MKNFIQPGQVITIKEVTTPVVSGEPQKVGDLVGVATGSLSAAEIAEGHDEYELALGGVYEFPDVDAVAATQGLAVAWDALNKKIVAAGSGTFDLGLVVEKTANNMARVLVNNKGEASGY